MHQADNARSPLLVLTGLCVGCSVDVTRKVLVAEAWCPVSAKPRVHEALREAAHTTSASVRPEGLSFLMLRCGGSAVEELRSALCTTAPSRKDSSEHLFSSGALPLLVRRQGLHEHRLHWCCLATAVPALVTLAFGTVC